MATTNEIVKEATKLGELIADHPAAQAMEKAANALQNDMDAQRAVTDMNRFAQQLEQKMRAGQPVEVEEKKKLETLQTAVVTNPMLAGLQKAQMDYVDLLRKVDDAITGATPDEPALPGAGVQGGGPGAMGM